MECSFPEDNDAPETSGFTIDENELWGEDDDLFQEDKGQNISNLSDQPNAGTACNGEVFESDGGETDFEEQAAEEYVADEVCDFNTGADFNLLDCDDFIISPKSALPHPEPLTPEKSISSVSLQPSQIKKEETVLPTELKPLCINDETNQWLEEVLQNEAFQKISDSPDHVLNKNLDFLNKSYVEILEKVMMSFENIPAEMLDRLPGFDAKVFLTLRTTKRRIKATIIRTENLLKRNKISSACENTQPNASTTEGFRSNSFNWEPDDSWQEKVASFSASPEITFKQPYQTVDLAKQKTNSITSYFSQNSSSSAPTKSLNSSFIDYTDLLYKSPTKSTVAKSAEPKRFETSMRNDGSTGEFSGHNYPHSEHMLEMFEQLFGLRQFRTNQLEVINAALLGHDCFVLMPTGGGKSLCYQLPAIVSPGVTVVISPLRSLIFDQVTKLQNLDIPAAHLSGELNNAEVQAVYQKLNRPEPDLKLLYVTPEKIGASASVRQILQGLYRRDKLARFVIDEVHCVSQWGHDFRPDYKKLRELRENYPTVNIMALTATATPRVRTDILHQLKINNPKWFLSSFNRSNLTYSVLEKKGKSIIKDIAQLIKNEHKNATGVIYCFSRKECEDVAQDLKNLGVAAIAYHAGLADNERNKTQSLWMNDKVKVVCATIAFGMGIDKLDVRFVIHYSLPKSIEGYYQESGRAGRDGEKATCILYYSHRDKIRNLKLINMDRDRTNAAARKIHTDNLYRVCAFAENRTDCRRALQLEYFGEKFDRSLCVANRSTACDNCRQQGEYETVDVTKESKAIVSAVSQICGTDDKKYNNYTMLYFVDIFKGSVLKKIVTEGHQTLPCYGLGKSWLRLDIERLFRKLIMEEFLKERLMVKEEGITLAYLKVGERGNQLLKGDIKIIFHIKKSKGKSESGVSRQIVQPATNPKILEIQEKCHQTLMDVIHGIAAALNCNPNAIMNVQAIRAMSMNLPETSEEMLAINHVTKANFEKYGAALLDVTQKFAAEKKALAPEPLPDINFDNTGVEDEWLTKEAPDDSPYFETDITFMGKKSGGGRGRGRGRGQKRKNGYRSWQHPKKAKGGASSYGAGSSSYGAGSSASKETKGRGRGRGSSVKSTSGATTVPGAKFSTLMDLPTNKSRFPRPKAIFKSL